MEPIVLALAIFGGIAYLIGGWVITLFIFTNHKEEKQYHRKDYVWWIIKKVLAIIFWPLVLIFFVIAFKSAKW